MTIEAATKDEELRGFTKGDHTPIGDMCAAYQFPEELGFLFIGNPRKGEDEDTTQRRIDLFIAWHDAYFAKCAGARTVTIIDRTGEDAKTKKAPFGYDRDNGVFVKNEREQEILTRIARLYRDGHTSQQIARDLYYQGCVTKTGLRKWRATTIDRIISNNIRVTAKPVDDAPEPVVKQATAAVGTPEEIPVPVMEGTGTPWLPKRLPNPTNVQYGYRLSGDKLRYEEVPEEQEIIKIIADMRAHEYSHGVIAVYLNEKNYKPRSFDSWTASRVKTITKRLL